MSDGIIVATDFRQEWLLSWWWDHFCQHNDIPVSFIDFGMSEEKKRFCLERGALIPFRKRDLWMKDREELAPEVVEAWDRRFSHNFWTLRQQWFKKPFACLLSPYRRTLWIDVDCEIRASLRPLFPLCESSSGMAVAKDAVYSTTFPLYNGGLLAFCKGSTLLHTWAQASLEGSDSFPTDQDLLSHLIAQDPLSIGEISPFYNWNLSQGRHPEAFVYHWVGEQSKALLQQKLALQAMLSLQ